MISNEWFNYINDYILLKGETLDEIDIEASDRLVHLNVIKQTVRTRRIVRKLTIGTDDATRPPVKLIDTFTSPNVKRQLTDSNRKYEWIRNGWIIREYRLKKDERTIDREYYRMGYVLFKYRQNLVEQAKVEEKRQLQDWLNKWELIERSEFNFELKRSELLIRLKKQLALIAKDVNDAIVEDFSQIKGLNLNWRFKKQLTFLHFLLALYQISMEESHFDWKEVGARYYRTIGGSKMFDLHKKDLIQQAELLLECPLHFYGLVTLGTITPIYFSGTMKSKHTSYQLGSVHATTDLAVFTDHFETTADNLWLVENRGVLTRMAFETEFLKATRSFVLAVDGQIRSSHRQLIQNIMTNVKQIIIWTDVDEAGLGIGKDAADLVRSSGAIIKWVVPPLKVVTTKDDFINHYQKFITKEKEEQEQAIGGVERWKEWIKN